MLMELAELKTDSRLCPGSSAFSLRIRKHLFLTPVCAWSKLP